MPSAASLALSCSSASASAPSPGRLREVGVELHLAVAVVDPEPAADPQALPRLDLEPQPGRVAPPHHRRRARCRGRAGRSTGGPRPAGETWVTSPSSQTRPSPSSARPARRTTSATPSGRSRLLGGRSPLPTAHRNSSRTRSPARGSRGNPCNHPGWRVVDPHDRMPIASAMAESTHDERDHDPGAPIARDAIDPELVKLKRPRPKVGVITARRRGVPVHRCSWSASTATGGSAAATSRPRSRSPTSSPARSTPIATSRSRPSR